ncbi:MAG: ABC transporter permease [Hespellia sp.]|nr:ABC transporter permease [Hespellia sp.]
MKEKNFDLGNFLRKFGIYFVLILMMIILSFLSKSFMTVSNMMNILRQVSVSGIVAMGMTLVLVTGGIDLSVGSMIAFAGVIGCTFAHPDPSYPLIVVILIGLAAGALCGLVNGLIVAYTGVNPFIATMGMMTIARGATLLFTNGRPINDLSESFQFIGRGTVGFISTPILFLIAVCIISALILHKTSLGRYIFAVGGNENAAKVSGINVKKIKIFVYIYSGILCGLAGLLLASRTNAAAPNAASGYELDAIAAGVIGGTSTSGGRGGVYGTIVGALIMVVLSNGLDMLNVSSYIQQIVKGIIIIGAVCIDQFSKGKDS